MRVLKRDFYGLVALSLALAAGASAQIGGPKDSGRAQAAPQPAAGAPAAEVPASVSQRFESQGLAVEFSLTARPAEGGKRAALVAGADADAAFRVTDAHTGQPVTGLRPSAWMSAREGTRTPNDAECKDKIRTFMGGLLSARPDVDLNSYQVLTLNHDNTVSFINPQVSFSKTKLEGIVVLPGAGADWALTADQSLLYVTIPDLAQVVVIDTVTKKLVAAVETGAGTHPRRVYLQPDGRYAWVGLDGSPRVAVIETKTNRLVKTVEVGAGLHQIAFTADGRFAYVTNSEAGTVSAVDVAALAKVADIAVGRTPVPVAYGPASRMVYVAAINGEGVSVVDPARQQVVKTIPAGRGAVALGFDPSGRYGFVVNQVQSKVLVIDSSTNQLAGSADVVKGPDQVTFTRGYAYVRGTESEKFSLIEVGAVSKGKLSVVDVQAGQKPPSAVPSEIGVADMIRATPEGNSVMVANTADQMIYYYVEGMMAPMGTLTNYKRRPHALMVVNRSLTETAPGVYTAPVRLSRPGSFDVPMLFDQPRLFKCFEAQVADAPGGAPRAGTASVTVEAAFKGQRFQEGAEAVLRFRVSDSVTRRPVAGLKDVEVLAFEPPGLWQKRLAAREVEEGVYEVRQVFPAPGLYNVMVGIASRGAAYADLPLTPVRVLDAATGARAEGEAKDASEKGKQNDE